MNNDIIKKGFLISLILIVNVCFLIYYDSLEGRSDFIFVFLVGIIPIISGLLLFRILNFKKRKYYYSKNMLLFFLYLVFYFLIIRFFGKSTYYYELYTIMFMIIPLVIINLLTFYKEKMN